MLEILSGRLRLKQCSAKDMLPDDDDDGDHGDGDEGDDYEGKSFIKETHRTGE